MTNNINIAKDLSQIFVRRDGKKAGPFEKIPEKNTYFDKLNHEIYTSNGILVNIKENELDLLGSNPEDLIALFIDDKNLCQCETCKFSRELLSQGIKTDLINKIESIRELIYNCYDKTIPENPNWLNISVSEQSEILSNLLTILSKHEGIQGIQKFFPDNVRILPNLDEFFKNIPGIIENPKENKKSNYQVSDDSILKWLTFQIFLFKEKNILIDVSIKKLSSLTQKKFDKLFNKILKQYVDSERIEEGLNIKIKL